MSYEWIYKLKPVKEVEPGWWRLKWRPIKLGTYNLYPHRLWKGGRALGLMIWRGGAHNGWGRSWEDLTIRVSLWWIEYNFWIRWNIKVMAEGPSDVAEKDKRPLDLTPPPQERKER